MATAERPRPTGDGLFATKPIDVLVEETHEKEHELKRAVGALDLTALGLGAIIGTGIFVIIGEAISTSGPSIVLAFVLAGVTCVFSALAFAELASAIPSQRGRTRSWSSSSSSCCSSSSRWASPRSRRTTSPPSSSRARASTAR